MRSALIISISFFILIFSGCWLFEDDFDGSWTVMVWLDADNNLEWAGMEDFNEMEHGLAIAESNDSNIMDKLAVIVQLDRAAGYDTGRYGKSSDWTGTQRYRIRPDYTGELTLRSRLLEDMGEVNMGSVTELKDFIQFCKEKYPADHYALIIWNHGGGVRSTTSNSSDFMVEKDIAIDEWDNDRIYTGEINQYLTDAEDVDLIGFDACLMGTLEIAYEFRPGNGKFGADFMAASVANEQGDGWEYYKIFERLSGTGHVDDEGDPCYNASNLTAAQLVQIIAKEYGDAFDAYTGSETMAALDLRTLNSTVVTENPKLALDALAASLAANNRKTAFENLRGSGSTVNSLEYFDQTSSSEWSAWPHFDLYDLAERVEANTGSFETETTAAQNLQSALENMILTSYGGSDYDVPVYTPSFQPGKNGLGIFFPDGGLDHPGATGTTPYYGYQRWYTDISTSSAYGSEFLYGRIDFCSSDNDGTVENWKEMLEAWYDPSNIYTDDDF